MLQLEYYPLFFAIIDIIDDQIFNVYLKCENSKIIEKLINLDTIRDIDYKWYLENTVSSSNIRLSLDDFTRIHRSIY